MQLEKERTLLLSDGRSIIRKDLRNRQWHQIWINCPSPKGELPHWKQDGIHELNANSFMKTTWSSLARATISSKFALLSCKENKEHQITSFSSQTCDQWKLHNQKLRTILEGKDLLLKCSNHDKENLFFSIFHNLKRLTSRVLPSGAISLSWKHHISTPSFSRNSKLALTEMLFTDILPFIQRIILDIWCLMFIKLTSPFGHGQWIGTILPGPIFSWCTKWVASCPTKCMPKCNTEPHPFLWPWITVRTSNSLNNIQY